MLKLIVTSLYLFLPAYVANMAPVICSRLNLFPRLAMSIDGSTENSNKPLFGHHKTHRGIWAGLVAGVITALVQAILYEHNQMFRSITLFPFETKNAIIWGLALSGGALCGDLVKSYIKRRIGKEPGSRWIPWDQLDQVIGGVVFAIPFYPFSFANVVVLLLFTPPLVLLVNIFSFWIGIKEDW